MSIGRMNRAIALLASVLVCLSAYSPIIVNSLAFGVHKANVNIHSCSNKSCRSSWKLNVSSGSSPESVPSTEPNTHGYDANTPVVLVGFSGPGDELYRLSSGLLNTLNPELALIDVNDDAASSNTMEFDEDDISEEFSDEQIRQMQLDGQESNQVDEGETDLEQLDKMLDQGLLDGRDVITLDLSSSEDDDDDEGTLEILNHLHNQRNCLVVYINVDPIKGNLTPRDAALQRKLEPDLITYSDYEIVVMDDARVYDKTSPRNWEDTIVFSLLHAVCHAKAPRVAVGSPETFVTLGRETSFLSLSYGDVMDAAPLASKLCGDVDAMELRTDLLHPEITSDRREVLYQLQTLRGMCRAHVTRAPAVPLPNSELLLEDVMPVVYTVRTAHQAGTWPDDAKGIEGMFELLRLGLRGGVTVLDVESAWDATLTDELLTLATERYGSTLILGSHHVVGNTQPTTLTEATTLFQNCGLKGRAHAAKVVLSPVTEEDGTLAYAAGKARDAEIGRSDSSTDVLIPNISLVLQELGQQSRVLNERFTPVTHEALPFIAAPGQLSAREIMKRKVSQRLISPRQYTILGHNIDYSVSPQMHNAAFRTCNLPHSYQRSDYETVEEFVSTKFFTSDTFGGASVTIPHKQSIMPYVDVLSDAARSIGSVNTVTAVYHEKGSKTGNEDGDDGDATQKRTLYGDNTDWIGIYNPLSQRIATATTSSGDDSEAKGTVLILGGGGTARAAAYAAQKLNCHILYYNRTPSKARELAETFGGTVLKSLEEDKWPKTKSNTLTAVISTLPAAAEFTLPKFLLKENNAQMVVFDVNYKPYSTPLLRQAEANNQRVVRGSEMLWTQGVKQFEIWMERNAPYGIMKNVVLENCLPKKEP